MDGIQPAGIAGDMPVSYFEITQTTLKKWVGREVELYIKPPDGSRGIVDGKSPVDGYFLWARGYLAHRPFGNQNGPKEFVVFREESDTWEPVETGDRMRFIKVPNGYSHLRPVNLEKGGYSSPEL
jgi:hypothetical protein